MNSWRGRSLVDLASLSVADIETVLANAQVMKSFIARGYKKADLLRGKSIVTIFAEASTRTRSSFELAGKYLGADVINITQSTSSMSKGESWRDTLMTLSALAPDALVLRHSASGAAAYAAELGRTTGTVPAVINAGDGLHAHPSQGLLDLFTVRESKGKIAGLTYAIVGDVRHSRVARSDMQGFLKMGAKVRLVGPRTLVPRELQRDGVELYDSIEDGIRDADVIQILRIQTERAAAGFIPNRREYARMFGLNTERLAAAKPDVMVMHPGPIQRGVEISHELAYAPQTFLQEQVRNGLAVRMAILHLVLNGGEGIEALAEERNAH